MARAKAAAAKKMTAPKTTAPKAPRKRTAAQPATDAAPKRGRGKKAEAATRRKDYICLVLDKSSSMDCIRTPTVEAVNRLIADIKQNAGDSSDTRVSLLTFSDAGTEQFVFFNEDVKTLQPVRLVDYRPSGMTALLDAVGMAIDRHEALPDSGQQNVSFLILPITDGGENNSSRYSRWSNGAERLAERMRGVQMTDRWSFAFQVPPGARQQTAGQLKVPIDNVREWNATEQGIRDTAQATSAGIGNYFQQRAAGKTKVEKFFVETDLSKVSSRAIHSKLDDLSANFRKLKVEKEVPIKEFVEDKTKKEFVIGSAYYLLTKPETVQARKNVLIMEKGKTEIFGGAQARSLIGLPDGVEAKVTPGNHSKFDVFVQSTSVNRKLVRGTVLLVDLTHTKNSVPTWDHNAVAQK